jgi:hypothetical protein
MQTSKHPLKGQDLILSYWKNLAIGYSFQETRQQYIVSSKTVYRTYDHRFKRTGHPVRSAIHKLEIGRLVVGWVTTSEYLLLYVSFLLFFSSLLLLVPYISREIRTPNMTIASYKLCYVLFWSYSRYKSIINPGFYC